MVYIIFICIVAPLSLMLLLLKNEARTLVLFMIMGMLICLSAYEINSLSHSILGMTDSKFTVYFTPVSEEILKALPVLFYALFISDKKEKLITVALSVGIGFAILENAYILVTNYETVTVLWAVIRGFATALMHGICTATIGFGAMYIYKKRKLFYTGTFGLLCCACTYHSIYNMLVQSKYDYVGFVLPIFTYSTCLLISHVDKVKKHFNPKFVSKTRVEDNISI